MSKEIAKYSAIDIQSLIYTLRGRQVMLDSDLAEMYGVETKRLNEQVKRNIARFPDSFRFQLTEAEFEELTLKIASSNKSELRSQIATLENERGKHRKYLPYVFTEQGVSMLSAVLRSDTAIQVSIHIMNAFVEMRKVIAAHSGLLQRMDRFELKLSAHDKNFEKVFKALEGGKFEIKQGVFFDGQTFDA